MRTFLLTAALCLCSCSAARPELVGRTASGVEVVRLPLGLSSAYLIKDVLIDAGASKEGLTIARMLELSGVSVGQLKAVLVTHGHCDHRGAAGELQRLGVPIWIGAGDVAMAKAGHNDELKPTRFSARLIHLTFSDDCEPFVPDVEVTGASQSLSNLGLDAEVFQLPGHTAGSLVVIVEQTNAFVGDMLMGGSLGGKLCPNEPHEHYFHADRAQNRENLQAMIDRGIEVFYVGHGGPLKRADVIKEFDLVDSRK